LIDWLLFEKLAVKFLILTAVILISQSTNQSFCLRRHGPYTNTTTVTKKGGKGKKLRKPASKKKYELPLQSTFTIWLERYG